MALDRRRDERTGAVLQILSRFSGGGGQTSKSGNNACLAPTDSGSQKHRKNTGWVPQQSQETEKEMRT